MSQVSKTAFLALYRELQKSAHQFPQYNYKKFFARRIRDQFEAYRTVTDQAKLDQFYSESKGLLETLQRQSSISKSFPDKKLIIERQ
uniref:Complex1_LYR_dom domain-containing protein n=1 Tax=Rhabditophanes sp. KR3021 TaxID=114890 RepID=A0AC35TH52_9BILA